MNIAVVDAGGNLVAHVRMDGAWIGSIDISINKAFTSRAFDIETKDLAQHSQSGGQFFGIHASVIFGPRRITLGPGASALRERVPQLKLMSADAILSWTESEKIDRGHSRTLPRQSDLQPMRD